MEVSICTLSPPYKDQLFGAFIWAVESPSCAAQSNPCKMH